MATLLDDPGLTAFPGVLAYAYLAVTLAERGRIPEAISHGDRAVRMGEAFGRRSG